MPVIRVSGWGPAERPESVVFAAGVGGLAAFEVVRNDGLARIAHLGVLVLAAGLAVATLVRSRPSPRRVVVEAWVALSETTPERTSLASLSLLGLVLLVTGAVPAGGTLLVLCLPPLVVRWSVGRRHGYAGDGSGTRSGDR